MKELATSLYGITKDKYVAVFEDKSSNKSLTSSRIESTFHPTLNRARGDL